MAGLVATACSGGGDGGTAGGMSADGAVEFAAEVPALPGFELDTGLRPEGSPAQVRAVVRSGGGFSAVASARSAGGGLEPVPGSGLITLGAELSLDVSAKVDVTGASWEGPLETISLSVPEVDAVFDPFLLEGEATTLSAPIPSQELLSAPLGSVPGGTIVITADTGTIEATFRGQCAAAEGEVASYQGLVSWSGNVQLTATIAIDLPVGKDPRFPITLTVDIPAFETPVDLGTRSMVDGSEVQSGSPCGSGKGDDAGEDSGHDDDVGTPDDGDGGEEPAATYVDILVERIKFSSTYRGTPWDGASGSAADPFVYVRTYGSEELLGRTTTVRDMDSVPYGEVVLTDVPVAELLERGIGFGIMDEDGADDQRIRSNVLDGDFPDEDFVVSQGRLIVADELDGSEQTYDVTYDGVSGSVVLRFIPVR